MWLVCDLCGMSTIYVFICSMHGTCACAVWVMWYIFNVCIVYMLGMYIVCVSFTYSVYVVCVSCEFITCIMNMVCVLYACP